MPYSIGKYVQFQYPVPDTYVEDCICTNQNIDILEKRAFIDIFELCNCNGSLVIQEQSVYDGFIIDNRRSKYKIKLTKWSSKILNCQYVEIDDCEIL